MRRTATAKILLTALTCGTAALAALVACQADRALVAWTDAGTPLLVALCIGWAGYFTSRRERARLTNEAAAAAERARELEFRLHLATAERQHAEAILYSISDAVLVTDPADDVVLANESAARTFEFDLSRVARSSGAPADALLRDPKILGLIRDMRQNRGGAARQIVEHEVETPTGRRTFKVTLSPVAADGGKAGGPDAAAGVVVVLHDVTRERDVSEMKNEFVSMVSHELRTPLASIKAYVEMLIDGEAVDDRTTREFYDVIQNEANRLGRLIDNILSISRIESGLVKAERRPQTLNDIVREAVDVISPQAAHKQIRLAEDVTPVPYRANIDKDMIYQAVLNLLSNSVKFTPEGGTVTVQIAVDAAAAARKVVVRVTDTGVGIAPRDLPFVFDKFYRAETGNRMASGTGLGLSLVKHIVEEVHGGRILVESHVGKGSCFGFELDLCE